ncbi:DUF3081 family protein [Pleionea sediminis]|uniref:DUF3081 family protein n=1 Tax=Pleionea sediminis TaxID=2569479 RepID=UPI001186FE96|nr:DUF3081 family protein [Pleionea sediminis]
MKNQLDIHKTLKIFQTIIKHGSKIDNKHRLNGVFADSDFDGYTIVLTDEKVTLTVFFHNKYQIDSPNKLAEQEFFQKLDAIHSQTFDA